MIISKQREFVVNVEFYIYRLPIIIIKLKTVLNCVDPKHSKEKRLGSSNILIDYVTEVFSCKSEFKLN